MAEKEKENTTKERIHVKKISECKQGALQIVNGNHNNTPQTLVKETNPSSNPSKEICIKRTDEMNK